MAANEQKSHSNSLTDCCIQDLQPPQRTGLLQEIEESEEVLNIFHNEIKLKEEKSSTQEIKNELANTLRDIESLKNKMKILQEECDQIKNDKIIEKSRVSAQLCKLITGNSIAKSNGLYVGANIQNPVNVFCYKPDEPDLAAKLWTKVEKDS